MILLSKGQVLEQVLADEALVFLAHLATADGTAARLAWESIANVDLESQLVQQLLGNLITAGILTPAVEVRRAALTAAAVPQVAATDDADPVQTYAHTYRVPIPPGERRPYAWIGQYLTSSCEARRDGNTLVVATDGLCTAPDATEVI